MFCLELIQDVLGSAFLRINSVQIYGRDTLQVRLLGPGDLYEVGGNPAVPPQPVCHVMFHNPNRGCTSHWSQVTNTTCKQDHSNSAIMPHETGPPLLITCQH